MSERRKIFSNSLSMLVNRFVQAIGTFILTAAIARTLGAEALGQYLLAASYYLIFVNIASQGLRTLFTRELSLNLEKMPTYLVSGTVLQLMLSTVAYVILVVVIWLFPYSAETTQLCYIFGLTIIPFSLSNVTEAIFQAQEKMHLIAISAVPVYVLRLIVMIWLMQSNYGVQALAEAMIISETIILVIQWLLLLKTIKPVWWIDGEFIMHVITRIKTFFAIEAAGIFAAKMDVLILSLLGSELLIGVYSGMTQLLQPYIIIVTSLGLAAFPSMTKAVEKGREQQRQTTENFIEFLLLMAVPIWIGIFFLGEDLLTFVYHDPHFSGVGPLFWISSFTVILFPFVRILGFALIANGFERFNLFEVLTTTVVGGTSGIILITQYELLGAVLMGVVVSLSAFSLLTWAVYTRLFALRFWKIFSRPLLIGGLMVPVFLLLEVVDMYFLGRLAIATAVYLLLVGSLSVYIFGGPKSALEKLLKRT